MYGNFKKRDIFAWFRSGVPQYIVDSATSDDAKSKLYLEVIEYRKTIEKDNDRTAGDDAAEKRARVTTHLKKAFVIALVLIGVHLITDARLDKITIFGLKFSHVNIPNLYLLGKAYIIFQGVRFIWGYSLLYLETSWRQTLNSIEAYAAPPTAISAAQKVKAEEWKQVFERATFKRRKTQFFLEKGAPVLGSAAAITLILVVLFIVEPPSQICTDQIEQLCEQERPTIGASLDHLTGLNWFEDWLDK